MAIPTPLKVTPTISDALRVGTPPELHVLKVRPPKGGSGVSDALELTKSLHHLEIEKSLLSTNVNSHRVSFEIWYDNESIDFYYALPNAAEEEQYRRQLAGFNSGISIRRIFEQERKFPQISSGAYVSLARLGATRHVFEPLWSVGGEDASDPYLPLLNAVDSQTDTKVVLQVLYEPVEPSWSEIGGQTIEEYSQRFEEEGILNERYFGRVSDKITDPTVMTTGAEAIRRQIGMPAYRVEVRVAVVSTDAGKSREELITLLNLFEKLYKGATKQTLSPISSSNGEDLFARMLLREWDGKGISSGISSELKIKAKGTVPELVLTAPELAGLAHLPSDSDVPVSGINYSEAMVDGVLPPDSENFTPVTKQEKQRAARNRTQTN